MTRPFTGWHMTAILVTFFGVVMTVNFVMARYAIGTFGGTVVDNSYVASQNYNRWLAQADAQGKLGWVSDVSLNPARQVQLFVRKDNVLLSDMTAAGTAIHPLGRAASIPLLFEQSATGALLTKQALPEGRWRVQLTLRKGPSKLKLNLPVQ